MLRKRMGQVSMQLTAIHANALALEKQVSAARIW
jgi:hypothetical protein